MRLLDELRRRWWAVPVLVIVLLLIFGRGLATFYTDILWYSQLGFLSVFSTRLATSLGLALAAGALVALLVGGNLLVARRLTPPFRFPSPQEEGIERYRELIDPFARTLLIVVSLVVGGLSALSVAGEWETFLLWANAQDFGRADPQFGLDLGFFVFRLPFWSFLNSWLFTVLAFAIVLTAIAHYLFGGIRPQSPGQKITPQAAVHLSLLLAALVAVRGWGFWLDRYMLSYSERGVITGLSYTDVNAELTAYTLLTIISGACVLLFLANLRYRNFLLPTAGVAILLVAAIVLSGAYPAAIQRFQVAPQELAREEPYIARNLDLTRFGFDLELEDRIETIPFPAENELPEDDARANADTLSSIRLWDPTVLSSVYGQLQGLRRYFEFADVDVDRYEIDGEQQQVNVAVRELQVSNLPDESWQNQHLVYTHGFGLVSTAVTETLGNGQPEFLTRDIPPTGVSALELDQPRVYFGERSPLYSVVNTQQPELDFGSASGAEEQQSFTYDGSGGVAVGNLLRRLAFAVRYTEPNLLLSNLLTDDSRILFNREIDSRVRSVAPFLQLDGDPYPVAVDGRVQWVLDAYTITDMLPYADRRDLGQLTTTTESQIVAVQEPNGQFVNREQVVQVEGLEGGGNYIRNSVKVVVDAYDGTVTLYVVDPDDPLIAAWRDIFPEIFRGPEDIPDELAAHFRYPEDLFRVQSDVFAQYHVPEAAAFYSREDAWEIPDDVAERENLEPAPEEGPPQRPYYLQMRLPGEEDTEFTLVQPFNLENRPNLTAWMAARSDPGVYGDLRVYEMPDGVSIDGPGQIQAQINQDAEVSEFITLLGQVGSQVRYGNLLTIPVGEALLYAQPLFVLAEQGSIPELRQVVLVLGDEVVMESSLEAALTELLGESAPDRTVTEEPGEAPPPPSDPGTVDPRVADLIEQALSAFAEADQALRDGDLGLYQEATQRAQDLLEEARALTTGEPVPGDSPSPSPSPSG
jgi:uncharacterized membrane protein (UPF0182 family)